MFRRIALLMLLLLALLLPLTAGAWSLEGLLPFRQTIGFVPRTADNIGQQLDAQIMRLLAPSGMSRDSVTVACTVPVYLGNFKQTSPLARQMSEELARYFMESGYRVDEMRKGNEVRIVQERGEFLLTREQRKLFDRTVNTEMILVGTYTITDRSVRFNMRLLHTPTQEVLAMAAGTVPVTDELAPLLADREDFSPFSPSVQTKLRR